MSPPSLDPPTGHHARPADVEFMEKGHTKQRWRFQANEAYTTSKLAISVRGVISLLRSSLNEDNPRPVIPLGHGDPSAFPCFRTTPIAEDAIVDSLRSAKFNCYGGAVGIPTARRAVAEYLGKDLPYALSPDDVFLTVGCMQAIEVIISVIARPGANLLLPRPGFPYYEARCASSNIEIRHFDLLPDRGWEVDLAGVEKLADENTVAMVIINPGNPCGSIFSYDHLKKVAEMANKLGIMVITDEVYAHLAFGNTPFTPMGVFGSIAPVVTLGSLSKRWIVPGWRLGWIAINDPNGILEEHGVVESIKGFLCTCCDPATFVQGAVPQIIQNTSDEFFSRITGILQQAADICWETMKDIPYITCPTKPEGSMFAMVKLNLSMLDGVKDDLDFCVKLAKEESVIVLPGIAVGMKNWLRVTFAIEPSSLEDGLKRIKAFCDRHAKKQQYGSPAEKKTAAGDAAA